MSTPSYAKLRLECLEDRNCPAPFALPVTVTTGGAKWSVSNSTSGPFVGQNGSVDAFGISDASLTGPGRGDAYDGAFIMAVNGVTYADPDGTVDLTGTTVTSDPATLFGLNVSVQYYFDPATATIRALYTFTNPTANTISATASVGHDLGSDSDTIIENTSDGNNLLDSNDRFLITSDGTVGGDPVLTFVRFGFGSVESLPVTAIAPGVNPVNGDGNDAYIDSYDITVPAGATRRILVFGQLSDSVANANTAVSTFDSNTSVTAAGLLTGLTPTQLAEIVNWNFGTATTITAGAGAGLGAQVKTFAFPPTDTGTFADPFPGFGGEVRVATGDVNRDGVADYIAGSGPGASHVKVFDGATGGLLHSFLAYDGFAGGVFVASGDVNGDGFADIITGADAGAGPHVKVFSGADQSLLASFFAYIPSFTGGVRVAAGDTNGDGLADVITGAGIGAGPHVQVIDGALLGLVGPDGQITDAALLSSFLAIGAPGGGVYVGAGDVNGDGLADVITGAGSGSSTVGVFSGADSSLLTSFQAYGDFGGGVRVAAGDLNHDGFAEIVTGAGIGGPSHVKVFDGVTQDVLASSIVFDPAVLTGVYVAVG